MSTPTAALRHGQDLMSDGSARGIRTSFPWQFRRFFSRQSHWLLLCLAALYLANISSQWREFPDSATYMLLAESLTEGQGYEIHGAPHGKYPPGFPIYLSLMFRLGLGDMLTLNIFMCGMTFLALFCSYKLLRLLTNPLSALVATLVCGFLFELYRVTGAQLSDVPFLLLISGGLWLLLKGLRERNGWMETGTVMLVASCWVRVLGIPLCLGIVCGILLSGRQYERTRALRAAALLTVGSLGTALWLFLRDRGAAADRALSSYSTELSAVTHHGPLDWMQRTITNFYHSGSFLSRLLTGQEIPAWLALWMLWIPLLVGVTYALVRKRQLIPILAATAYLGSILILRVPLARYLLPIAPLILLYLGQGIQIIAHVVAERFSLRRRYRSGFVWACAALLIICNLPKDLRYAYRTHHPARVALEGRLDVSETSKYLQTASSPDAPFVSNRYPHLLSYLSQQPVMPFRFGRVDDEQSLDKLLQALSTTQAQHAVIWPTTKVSASLDQLLSATSRSDSLWRPTFCSGNVIVLGRVSSEADAVAGSPATHSQADAESTFRHHVGARPPEKAHH